MSISARVVNFSAEMFNDSLYFLEEAKKLGSQSENDWLRWRYLRASIIFSLTSFEAYVNTFIAGQIANTLKLQGVAKGFANDRSSLSAKLENIIPILTGKELDKTQPEWTDFQIIRKIRNRIMHYTGGTQVYNDADFYGVNITNAEKGISMTRGLIRQLTRLVGKPSPAWVNQAQSRTIR